MGLTKRASRAIALSKSAAGNSPASTAEGIVSWILLSSFLGAGALGAGAGALASKATSPSDVDMDNARKEYKASSMDSAIAELSTKLRNERVMYNNTKGTNTMRKAMRLV